jgi:opacity protein-like surface antigen
MVRQTMASACAFLLFSAFAQSALAQNAGRAARIELTGFGGWSAGLDTSTDEIAADFATGLRLGGARNVQVDSGSGFQWLAGVGVGVPVGERLIVVGEFTSNRLASVSATGTVGGSRFNATASLRLSEFTAGAHYLLRPPDTAIVPYVGAAVGVVRLTATGSESTVSEEVSVSESDSTFNFGGGVRFKLTRRSGLRPELKVVRIPDETYTRVAVGFFYHF